MKNANKSLRRWVTGGSEESIFHQIPKVLQFSLPLWANVPPPPSVKMVLLDILCCRFVYIHHIEFLKYIFKILILIRF